MVFYIPRLLLFGGSFEACVFMLLVSSAGLLLSVGVLGAIDLSFSVLSVSAAPLVCSVFTLRSSRSPSLLSRFHLSWRVLLVCPSRRVLFSQFCLLGLLLLAFSLSGVFMAPSVHGPSVRPASFWPLSLRCGGLSSFSLGCCGLASAFACPPSVPVFPCCR